ncbi:MAG: FmdB family zinc ribbon protein [Opitutales bacterium]
MPVYVYEVVDSSGKSGERFEIVQSMRDAALTHHPDTGAPVRRVLFPPNLSTKYPPGATASKLDNRNVEAKGFTKYEKDKLTGRYHKVAGKQGPSTLDPS